MKKIYLIRHSITQGNLDRRFSGHTDDHLCDKGIELAKTKVFPRPERIYISPLTRCRQTSDIIFNSQRAIVRENLREMSFGEFDGFNDEELKDIPEYVAWINKKILAPPKGETVKGFFARVVNEFEEIIDMLYKDDIKTCTIVTHGGTIMAIMNTYFRKDDDDFYTFMVDNCGGFELDLEKTPSGINVSIASSY